MSIKGEKVYLGIEGFRIIYSRYQRCTVINLEGHRRMYDGDVDMCTYLNGKIHKENESYPGTSLSNMIGCELSALGGGTQIQFRRYSGVFVKISPGHVDFRAIITSICDAMSAFSQTFDAAGSRK